ncbi:MAG: chorismate lyase [Gammaproteobacteria bacterium]|nr:chorismate lyase [Gammaproteobacteria bacterium]
MESVTPVYTPAAATSLRRQWFPARIMLAGQPLLGDWLLEPGSLTARLVQFSQGRFQVRVLAQYWGVAAASESRLLGIAPRARVLVREVILEGCGQPWVYARSILPRSSLTGSLQQLSRLDAKPLGSWLFKQPTLRRGPLQISRYCVGDQRLAVLGSEVDLAHAQSPLLGRRSVFYVEQKPILVGEVFLPDFMGKLHAADGSSVGPRTVGPRTVGPRSVGPRSVGPRTVGPPAIDFCAAGMPTTESSSSMQLASAICQAI